MTTKFGSAFTTEYIAIATPYAGTNCTVYDSSGNAVESQTATGSNGIYKICFGCGSDTTYISGPWKVECNASVYAYYEGDTDTEETNVLGWMQMRQYVWPEPTYTVYYNDEEDRYTGIWNKGNTSIKGYLWMLVEQKTDSGWQPIFPPVVNDRATGTLRTINPGEKLNISQIWQDAGGWNTDRKPPGEYRAYVALQDPSGNVLESFIGFIEDFDLFEIIKVELKLTELEHENEYESSINEYEVGDRIDWINVTITALNNTALDANITLNLLDQNKQRVGWGPNETKLCGDIPEGDSCEKTWDNSTYGYPIPLDASSGTYTFYWNVTMMTYNGDTKFNNSLTFKIHNIPNTFSSVLQPTRLYKPSWGWYNFTFTNLWSRNLTDVKVKINCPSVTDLVCDCGLPGQSGNICVLSEVENGTSVTVPFNISVSDTTPIGDYNINATLNYTNPGDENRSWVEYENQILEVRSPELLEITIVEIPENVTRGYEYNLSAYINNTASFVSHNVWLNYMLPSGCTNTSGNLTQYNETLCSYCLLWNNVTVNVGLSSSLGPNTIRLDSGSDEGQEDWKTVTVYVYANTSLINFVSSDPTPNRGETVTLQAKLIYDNGNPVVNENVSFYDETTNKYLGSDLTDSNGIASIQWTIPTDAPLGDHVLNVTYLGSTTAYTHGSYNNTTVNIGALPSITNVSVVPNIVGYGYNVTITANVTDEDGISKVFAKVWYPNGSVVWLEMNNYTSKDLYKTNFTDTWQYGYYNYTIWANDTQGNYYETLKYTFRVKVSATVYVQTDNETYSPNSYVNITPYQDNWWHAGWSYRKKINITNTLTNDLTNYPRLGYRSTCRLFLWNSLKRSA